MAGKREILELPPNQSQARQVLVRQWKVGNGSRGGISPCCLSFITNKLTICELAGRSSNPGDFSTFFLNRPKTPDSEVILPGSIQ